MKCRTSRQVPAAGRHTYTALALLACSMLGAAWCPTPGAHATEEGSELSAESFAGSTVDDARWLALGDACLTAAGKGADAPAGKSGLGGCTHADGSPTLGEGSDGYLQLTDDTQKTAGAVLFDRPFSSAAGLVVEFDEYQYQGVNTSDDAGDGIGLFLVDGAYTLDDAGSLGGGLGYATVTEDASSYQQGIPHGYLGLGLDVFGNYAKQPYVGYGCEKTYSRTPGSVVLRGAGDTHTNGYCRIAGAQYGDLENEPSSGPTGSNGTPQRVRFELSPTTADDPYPTVTVSINGTQILQGKSDAVAPATLKFGFAASTGDSHAVHLIGNMEAKTVDPVGAVTLTKILDRSDETGTTSDLFTAGDTVPFSYLVTNSGTDPLSDIAVTDPEVVSVTCPKTTLAHADSMTCTGTTRALTDGETTAGSFTSEASVAAVDSGGERREASGSATINTYASGALAVRQQIDGTGAELIDPTSAYSVAYSYPSAPYEPRILDDAGDAREYAAGSGTVSVTANGSATVPEHIPAGATVTLHEDDPQPVEDATWGELSYGDVPVTIVGGKTNDVTISDTLDEEPGSVSWTKESVDGVPLAGSAWQLTLPTGETERVTESDVRVTSTGPGAFTVGSLPWGAYALQEVQAPDGYLLDPDPHTFTIAQGHRDVDLDAIVDQVAPSPSASPAPAPPAAASIVVQNHGSSVATGGHALADVRPWLALILCGSVLALLTAFVGALLRVRRSRGH